MAVFITTILLSLIIPVFPRKRIAWFFVFASLVLAFVGGLVQVKEGADISWHAEVFDLLKANGFRYAMEFERLNNNLGYTIFAFLSSLVFPNYHYMIGLVCFIGYGLLFLLLYLLIKDYNLKTSSYSVIFIWICCMMPFFDFAGGVRGALAFSICSLVLYCDFNKKMNKLVCVLLYIVAFSFHQAAIVAIILRILLISKSRKFHVFLCVLVFLFGVFGIQIANLLNNLASNSGVGIISSLTQSFYIYMNRSFYEYGPALVKITASAMVLAFLFIIRPDKKTPSKLIDYYLVLCSFVFGFIYQFDFVNRYAVLALMVSPCVLSTCLSPQFSKKFALLKPLMISASLFVLTYYTLVSYSKFSFGW